MIDEYSDEQYMKEEIEKGIQEATKKNAKAMIEQGLELSLISKITGILAEELARFQ